MANREPGQWVRQFAFPGNGGIWKVMIRFHPLYGS
jgi:hypothetical protein